MRVIVFAAAAGVLAACATQYTDEEIAAIEAACEEGRDATIEERVEQERAEDDCAAAAPGAASSQAIRDAAGKKD